MKMLLALMILCLGVVGLVGCEDHDHTNTVYVDVPDPIVTNTNIVTPGGLTIVEIVNPNGLPAGVTQDQVLADLDYQVLYVWYTREFPEFAQNPNQFNNLLKQAQFHLVFDTRFKVNKDRNVHYAQIGNDIFLAVLRMSSDGHYVGSADTAMDLYSGDVNEGHDSPVVLWPATFVNGVYTPTYPPLSSYYVIH